MSWPWNYKAGLTYYMFPTSILHPIDTKEMCAILLTRKHTNKALPYNKVQSHLSMSYGNLRLFLVVYRLLLQLICLSGLPHTTTQQCLVSYCDSCLRGRNLLSHSHVPPVKLLDDIWCETSTATVVETTLFVSVSVHCKPTSHARGDYYNCTAIDLYPL
jgi:hypothetical protein